MDDKHRCSTTSLGDTQPGCGDLIARLEKAWGPSIIFDGEIFRLVGPEGYWRLIDGVWHRSDYAVTTEVEAPPPYTGSLDAALTLVPDGKDWDVAWITADSPRYKWKPKFAEATVYSIDFWQREGVGWKFICEAATPALALCVAGLKARAASVPQTGPVELSEQSNTDTSPNPVAQSTEKE